MSPTSYRAAPPRGDHVTLPECNPPVNPSRAPARGVTRGGARERRPRDAASGLLGLRRRSRGRRGRAGRRRRRRGLLARHGLLGRGRGRRRGRAGRGLAHQVRLRLGVETAGHLDVLGLLVVAQGRRRARAVDAVDRARIVAFVLQRGLRLTDVRAALHLAGDLVLGLARLGLGLVHAAVDLGADRVLVARGLGLVLGFLVAADLGLDLVLGLDRLLLGLVPSLGGLLLGLVPGLGGLLLDGVLGVDRLVLERLVVGVRAHGRDGAQADAERDGQGGCGELVHGWSSSASVRVQNRHHRKRRCQALNRSSAIFFTSAASTCPLWVFMTSPMRRPICLASVRPSACARSFTRVRRAAASRPFGKNRSQYSISKRSWAAWAAPRSPSLSYSASAFWSCLR